MAGPGEVPGRKKKVESEKDVEFAEGGDTPMFGKGDRTVTDRIDSASPQSPGRTEQHPDKGSGKYAEGGKTKMFGYSPAVPAKEGITGAR